MARTLGRLTTLAVTKAKQPGMLADGGGLWLQVTGPDARSWIFRFKFAGRPRSMGLGPLHTVGLAEARELAAGCRRLVQQGIDPIEARKARRDAAALDVARAVTFDQAAAAYIAAHRAGWRNAPHASQWENTIAAHASPVFGSLPVQAVDLALVMKALEPIWATRPETASRLRGRIEAILDWAKTHGYRTGENPARWRGHLENLLPSRRKVRPVAHLQALPYVEIGTFMAELRAQNDVAAWALEFLILTACRSGELRGARWAEIDLKEPLWTIPASRTKAGKEHRIPLSPPALAIVERLAQIKLDDLIVPSGTHGRMLDAGAMLDVLQRLRPGLTVHGFRSTFRDWCAEQTNFPRDVAEMALAHAVGSQVEAAYRRGDLIEKRRLLMHAWAKYCGTVRQAADVVPIRHAGE